MFAYLVETKREVNFGRKIVSLQAAIILHLFAFASIIIFSMFIKERIDPPNLFYNIDPSPNPPQASSESERVQKPRVIKKEQITDNKQLVAPITTPDLNTNENVNDQNSTQGTGNENGPNILGILIDDKNPLQSDNEWQPITDNPQQFDYGSMKVPVEIPSSRVKPEYPSIARMARLEGTIYIELIIDEKGNVISARIIKSTNSVFDEPSLKAARQLKFTPCTKSGIPVRVYWPVRFIFKLE